MNKYLLLMKNYFKMYVNSFQLKRNSSSISGALFLIIIATVFVMLFTSMSISQVDLSIRANEPSLALYTTISSGLLFTCLIIILKSTNQKKSKDYEMLLSLPFSKKDIILAKVSSNLIFDILTLSLILLPSFIVYYIMVENSSISVVLFGILIILLLSILSNALSILLRFVIDLSTRNFSSKDVIRTIINVIITILFIAGYYYITTIINDIDTGAALKLLDFIPIKIIVDILLNGNLLYLLIVILICVIPFILATFLSVITINKTEVVKRINNKTLVFKQKKVIVTLVLKELSRYFRSTLYVVNTILPAFILILMSLLLTTIGVDYFKNALTSLGESKYVNIVVNNFPVIVIMISAILASSIITTHSSISIEGKSFWILKAHPIDYKTIIVSKILMNIIIGIIPVIISSIILCFLIGPVNAIMCFIVLVLCLISGSCNGIFFNLMYPKLDYKDEEEIIKRSFSVNISCLTTAIPELIMLGLYILVFNSILSQTMFLVLNIVIILLVDIIWIFVLRSKGKKLFNMLYI